MRQNNSSRAIALYQIAQQLQTKLEKSASQMSLQNPSEGYDPNISWSADRPNPDRSLDSLSD
ncbi:MAG: hypothetical protein HC772_04300 [Leptolyngbyaceae cyanobacterium CRU_2_3]|nr:hypothetical protein [Leptolyngbyaceae cyanobacterium CRU_2_3]